ncbi:MAG: caspase family protein [Treponema sp.]|nr:caspase family protein [Treponema sp.]
MRKKFILLCGLFTAVFFLNCAGSSETHRPATDRITEFNNADGNISVFPQLGHTKVIYSGVFSPDGKYILSNYNDDTFKLWDTESGREIRTFFGHTSTVLSVAFSPDGKYILSGSGDSNLKLWDTETGQEIRTFSGHRGEVYSVAFSPDGNRVLSGSGDNTLKLWDLQTGRGIRTFSGHTGGRFDGVRSVSFSPDGKYILSGSTDNTLKLWDTETGWEIRTFSGHTGSVGSVAFSPDGKQVLSGSRDSTLKLWDTESGMVIRSIAGHSDRAGSVSFSPDGKRILSCSGNLTSWDSKDSIFVLWDAETGNEIRVFSGHTDTVNSVAFSPDGKHILSGSNDLTLKVWDTETGLEIKTLQGHSLSISSVAFSPDGKLIISSPNDTTLRLWDVETGNQIKIFSGHTENIHSAAFSPDGKHIVSGSSDRTIKLWDVVTGMVIRTFTGHTDRVNSVIFSPDGMSIVSGSEDKTFKLWDTETGRQIRSFSERNGINSVAFSRDGRQIIAGSTDGSIKLLDVAAGIEIRTFFDGSLFANSVAFSPDGRQIISGYLDRSFKLWDAATGRVLRNFSGHTGWVSSVAFSPDGKLIISSSSDNTIKLWDTATGQEIRTFYGHTNSADSISFSFDGKTILSGSYDGTARLWDVATGNEIATFISFSGTDTQLTAASRGLLVEETETAASSIDGEWLAITPDGYYQASPRGDRFLNVRINNTVSGIDAFRSIFYNPDVVQARLQGLPDPASKRNISIQQAAAFIPPAITIQSPANFSTTTTANTSLSVNITDQNQPLQNVRVFVNGRPASREELAAVSGQGLQAGRSGLTVTGNQQTVNFTMPLELDPGSNFIEVVAFNGFSENRRHVDVTWNAPAGQRPALPNLWILAVGVNHYDNAGPRLGGMGSLNFAVADARTLISSLRAQEGRRYGRVNSLLIADGESLAPTAENIRRNLAFLDQAGDRDVVLLFLAGHGLSAQGGQFFFLPRDAAVSGSGGTVRVDASRAISGDEITAILEGHGRRLLLIDACNSGGVDSNRMIRGFMESNAFVFASSQGSELSYESPQWGGGHGVFTYSVLNALRGAPAALAGNNVSVRSMSGFVSLEVPRHTQNRQNPRVHSLLFGDFPLAEIR